MKETANETARRFNRMQWRMLFATMIGYTLFYFMRKNFSFAMPGLQQDCGISKSMLGNFLFWGGIVYGLSKFLNGIVCSVSGCSPARSSTSPSGLRQKSLRDWGTGNRERGTGVLL